MDEHEESALTRRGFVAAGAATAAGLASAALPEAADAQRRADDARPLRGQVALVTGAARGIGRACAVALAEAGADVALLDIARDIAGHSVPMSTPADLAESVRLVQATGRRAIPIQADIRDMGQMRAAVERTVGELGRLDILFANAGINSRAPLLPAAGAPAQDPGDADRRWRNVLDVNVLGTANSIRAVLPHMAARRSGRIIATASTFGRQGAGGGNANYAASKWAVVGLVKSAAIDAGPYDITVNAVAPTGVVTGLGGPRTAAERAEGDEFFRTQYHTLPVGTLQPRDIAGTVVFLASPGSRYVTGAVIDVAAGANARYTA